jgi:hypothetical protein
VGNGRYAIINNAGQKWIVDLEERGNEIRQINDGGWIAGLELADGKSILKVSADGLSLYSLPSLKCVSKYENVGQGGDLFTNGIGSVIGINRGYVFYLVDRATGKSKGYGIDGENHDCLTEVKYVQRELTTIEDGKSVPVKTVNKDIAIKVIDLKTLKAVKTFSVARADDFLLTQSSYLGSFGFSDIHSFPGRADFWVVIKRSESFNKDKQNGDSLLMHVGEDFEIKKIFHCQKLIRQCWWDDETRSLIFKTPKENYCKIQLPNS